MTWKVFRENPNSRAIEEFDIFRHSSFAKDVQKLLKENATKEEFAEKLKRILIYYFWCKSEWEVVITSWPPYIDKAELDRLGTAYEKYHNNYGHYPYCLDVRPTVGEKVDIYSQVALNWDHFVDYVWQQKEG